MDKLEYTAPVLNQRECIQSDQKEQTKSGKQHHDKQDVTSK